MATATAIEIVLCKCSHLSYIHSVVLNIPNKDHTNSDLCVGKCLKQLHLKSWKKGSSVPSVLTPILTLNYSSASMSTVEIVLCAWWFEASRDNLS